MLSTRSTMTAVCRAPVAAAALTLCGLFLGAEAQTLAPALSPCALRSNTSCAECLKTFTCLWCVPTQQCMDFPVKYILFSRSECPLADARWGVCWVNFKVVSITLCVLVAVIILTPLVCCLCCKCRRAGSKREEAKVERHTRVRSARQKARRTEMQLRHDEIRQKYGLAKDNPYCRMHEH